MMACKISDKTLTSNNYCPPAEARENLEFVYSRSDNYGTLSSSLPTRSVGGSPFYEYPIEISPAGRCVRLLFKAALKSDSMTNATDTVVDQEKCH